MGATTFVCEAIGRTAEDAFRNAVRDAVAAHGNAGYTGSIAEKRRFVKIALPEGEDPVVFAYMLLDGRDYRVDNKWGPAGCVELPTEGIERKFLFFGWASS